jgi:hypothetical protein
MKHNLFSPRHLGLGAAIVVMVVPASAQASTTAVDTSWCATPTLSQPFRGWKDANWYALAPGESDKSFDGAGWELSGGARIITAMLDNGSVSSVLDLPTGARAVSPPMCVTSDYPRARTMVRNLNGTGGGVSFYVADAGTDPLDKANTLTKPMQVKGKRDWMLSPPVNVAPGKLSGWRPVQFTFIGDPQKSEFQIYDFYIDPRMAH